jgi:hypothetical protein
MEKDKDRDERTHDLYGEDDIPKSNILDITLFMDKNAKDVVDYLEQKTVEDYDPTGEIYDRILSKLVNEFPFGPTDGRYYYDKVHVILANALTACLWLGWLSQAMTNKKDQKFKAEYVELFKIAIEQAYKVGRKYSSQRP